MDTGEVQNTDRNKLANELSPYLLQHADNPVDWHPWSDEAFEKAEQENKLVLISIGYSACHWCHVMERESFSDPEVASMMNKYFVSIKVDREERPDIDSIYLDAVQLITGTGGWPLNCFTLPNGIPIFGGTYFNKSQWLHVINTLAEFYREDPSKIEYQAQELKEKIQTFHKMDPVKSFTAFEKEDLTRLIDKIKDQLDHENGGLKGAPKFPMPVLYQFLLNYQFHTGDSEILDHILLTLNKMKDGGIYDQIGGGFARYATDEEWEVPHFEKMLYDNALLASLYSQSYLYTKQEHLKQTVIETLDFIMREMMSDQYLFYSSIDADNEQGEGAFYTWEQMEIEFILHNNADLISDYFGLHNGQKKNQQKQTLLRNKDISSLAVKYNLSEDKVKTIIQEAKQKLFAKREKRPKPHIDKKIVTGWNALVIKAFLDGYRATGKNQYIRIALNSAENLIGIQLQNDYKLNRILINGQSSVNGFLDDYALLADVMLELYQLTFDAKWVDWAFKLSDYVIKNFSDQTNDLFLYASLQNNKLISNKNEIIDTVMPSPNSVIAKNLFVLGQYYNTDAYKNRSRRMIANVQSMLARNPFYFSQWLNLMLWFIYPPYEISIVGKKADEYKKRFDNLYHPGIILAGGTHEGNLPILKDRFKLGKTQIHICQEKVCQKPLSNVDEAMQKIV